MLDGHADLLQEALVLGEQLDLTSQPTNQASRQGSVWCSTSSLATVLDGHVGLLLQEDLVPGQLLHLTSQPANQPSQQAGHKRKCVALLPPLLPSCLTVMRAFFSREIWSLASCSTMSSSLRRCSCSWDSSFCHRLPCTDATSWNSLQACPENQKINRFIIFKTFFNILYALFPKL